MGGALESATRQLFEALDRKDMEALAQSLAQDAQGVDEISRRWMRGAEALGKYLRETIAMIEDVHSTINDVHETVNGDIGFTTCWLEQDYTLEGTKQHVSAPTTVVFRRDHSAWKMVLFESIPLPPESA